MWLTHGITTDSAIIVNDVPLLWPLALVLLLYRLTIVMILLHH